MNHYEQKEKRAKAISRKNKDKHKMFSHTHDKHTRNIMIAELRRRDEY